MKKAPETKGERTRNRLLKAATKQFSEAGLAGARVHDIVRQAGLSQAAFYIHFKSKEGLYHELLDGFLNGLEDMIYKANPPTNPVEIPAHMLAHLTEVFEYLAERPELTTLALKAKEGEPARRALATALSKKLESLAPATLVEGLDTALVAEAIVGAIERLTVRWLLTGERTPEELAIGVFGFIYHSIHRT